MLRIATAKGPVFVAGTGDLITGDADPALALKDVPQGADVICLTHQPDIFPRLPRSAA